MIRLLKKLFGAIKYRYDDYQNWKMKMNVPISIKIVYTPPKKGSPEATSKNVTESKES